MPSHAIPPPLLRASPSAPAAFNGRRAPPRVRTHGSSLVVAASGGGRPAGRGMEQHHGDGSRSPGSSSFSFQLGGWPWVGVWIGGATRPESPKVESGGHVHSAPIHLLLC
ncbi:hypothetical protein ABZP36_018164 [Zizania latifolia]